MPNATQARIPSPATQVTPGLPSFLLDGALLPKRNPETVSDKVLGMVKGAGEGITDVAGGIIGFSQSNQGTWKWNWKVPAATVGLAGGTLLLALYSLPAATLLGGGLILYSAYHGGSTAGGGLYQLFFSPGTNGASEYRKGTRQLVAGGLQVLLSAVAARYVGEFTTTPSKTIARWSGRESFHTDILQLNDSLMAHFKALERGGHSFNRELAFFGVQKLLDAILPTSSNNLRLQDGVLTLLHRNITELYRQADSKNIHATFFHQMAAELIALRELARVGVIDLTSATTKRYFDLLSDVTTTFYARFKGAPDFKDASLNGIPWSPGEPPFPPIRNRKQSENVPWADQVPLRGSDLFIELYTVINGASVVHPSLRRWASYEFSLRYKARCESFGGAPPPSPQQFVEEIVTQLVSRLLRTGPTPVTRQELNEGAGIVHAIEQLTRAGVFRRDGLENAGLGRLLRMFDKFYSNFKDDRPLFFIRGENRFGPLGGNRWRQDPGAGRE